MTPPIGTATHTQGELYNAVQPVILDGTRDVYDRVESLFIEVIGCCSDTDVIALGSSEVERRLADRATDISSTLAKISSLREIRFSIVRARLPAPERPCNFLGVTIARYLSDEQCRRQDTFSRTPEKERDA
ncbi:MAG: hypothetical protein ACKVOH_00805 [Chlamydiales bacterium]